MNNPKHIDPRLDPTRTIRAPRGSEKTCKSWLTEAAYRMIQNNLDAEVAEHPHALVVYGGIGRAARNWDCFDQILATLKDLNDDETLLIQSGKPVGVFRTHADAPRVLLANSNLVPKWATWEHFNELDRKGLMMYGQMTAGSWIYIGSQGIVQGTYETFAEMGRQHFGGDLAGKWILTAGLGGMGGAQLARLRPHRRDSEKARGERDVARAVGQAGRRFPHAPRCAARLDRKFQSRAALGRLGAFQRTR